MPRQKSGASDQTSVSNIPYIETSKTFSDFLEVVRNVFLENFQRFFELLRNNVYRIYGLKV
jgi:hypothetical protein